ncbi:MAG: hypothetical protein ABH847_05390 [Candidatus Omnitrophota bacterium]
MRKAKRRSSYLKYTLALFFLISFVGTIFSLADEILTSDGRQYEGIIINQSPYEVTIKVKDETIKLNRSNLKYVKKWPKEKNDALVEEWKAPQGKDNNLKAREEELKFADSVRHSDQPWEIYEEGAFIAFHHQEGVIRSRLQGKVGDYCKKVADKLGYSEFKLFDKSASPDWNLKFKFYSYRDFKSWKNATAAEGMDVSNVAAFAAGKRRVFFYELYMKEDVIYHEISHEIYNEFVRNAKIPAWWSEGVAQYTLLATHEAREYISRSRFRALNNRYIHLTSHVLGSRELYEDGLSLIYFLVRDKGKEKFQKFNYKLREGVEFNTALSQVYGFKDTGALEEAWVGYLKNIDVQDMVGE